MKHQNDESEGVKQEEQLGEAINDDGGTAVMMMRIDFFPDTEKKEIPA